LECPDIEVSCAKAIGPLRLFGRGLAYHNKKAPPAEPSGLHAGTA
jgi:hypothetical protein